MSELGERFRAKATIGRPTECWPWTGGKSGRGYGVFWFEGRQVPATHVSVYLHTGHRVPDGAFVLHSCDNPPCVNPAHLRVGDQVANMADMDQRGHRADVRGARHPQALLTEAAVAEIRASSGSESRALAAKYGISTRTVRAVRSGERWPHV